MDNADTEKFILRYMGEGNAPAQDVARIKEACDIEVLDMSARMALVCGTPSAVSDLTHSLLEWQESPMREMEIPDSRPKVKEAPAPPRRAPAKRTTPKRSKK